MGAFLAKAIGWAIAHKDALGAGWSIFRALRGRRKSTQESGQSFRDFYTKEGLKVLRNASPVKKYGVSGLERQIIERGKILVDDSPDYFGSPDSE